MKKTPEEEIEINFAIDILDRHFKEVIFIGGNPTGTGFSCFKFGDSPAFVQHGKEEKLNGIMLESIPSILYAMKKEERIKSYVIFNGLTEFLKPLVGSLSDMHVIFDRISK